MTIYTANKTSACLLVDYATEKWGPQAGNDDPETEKLFLIIYDLYIKARSYAIINKVAFWLAVIAGILVLLWPSLAVISKDYYGFDIKFLNSAVVQTTVTGLSVLIFSVYHHYKKSQMHIENLMRHIIYSEQTDQTLFDEVLKELERIDAGFSFSDAVSKKKKKQ